MLVFLKKNQSLLLFCTLFLCALLLYSNSLRHRDHTTLFEKSILQLTSPFYRGMDRCTLELSTLWNNYLYLVSVQQQNIQLHNQLLDHRRRLLEFQEIEQENLRLRKLLNFLQDSHISALPARIIAEDASNWFRTITIDKGSSDGLCEGLPVVVAEGIVGRTIKCAADSSRVLLAIDAASEVAALIQDNRTRGVVRGKGSTLTFDYALRNEEVNIGDAVVTAGTGGIFPKGLAIGTISSIITHDYGLFHTLELTPSVDFSRLEDVLVILPPVQ